jgi:hypothetical protein
LVKTNPFDVEVFPLTTCFLRHALVRKRKSPETGNGGVSCIKSAAESAATMGVVFFAAPVNAQGVQQTVPIAKVDVQTVAAGNRASKVIGSSVLNEARSARLTTFL